MNKAELQKKLGKRVIELRTKKGWSQADLARACFKDRQAIEKIENGRTNPTLYTLFELAKVLDVEANELLKF